MEEFRFKVNLGGMIEILSDHLYSSPDVYIRELLQNGVDAIVGREKVDEEYKQKQQGKLSLKLDEQKSLSFRDNGVGLTKEEIHRFLAIIGESSKRDIESGKILSDYIGRFGIGMLSCFMVADNICIRTRSVSSNVSYEWIGKPDGTYTLVELQQEIPVGTEIYLEAKNGCEEYFKKDKVEELLMHYGFILPYPILLDDGVDKKRANPTNLPWEGNSINKQELLMFGQIMFQTQFMDCIVLHSEEGQLDGVAYILPYSVQPSTKQNHLIYLKNMLLTEKGQNILPDWAVFTKCIINARELRPTASRESFYEDETLELARNEIGKCIADYLKELAQHDKITFQQFLDVHSLVVKSIAIEDDELYQIFIEYLEFVTTRGVMTGRDLCYSNEPLLYCGMDEYRQLSQMFFAQGKLLINAGYVYSRDLLLKMQDFFDVEVLPVDFSEVEDLLKDVSLEEAEDAVDLLEVAETILKPFACDVEIKQYIPANLPAFFYQNEDAKLLNEIKRVQEKGDNLFWNLLNNFADEIEEKADAVLYFNMRNPIVKKMITTDNRKMLEDIIIILYVQTLLIGGFPLRNNELGMMNDRLLSIMERNLL